MELSSAVGSERQIGGGLTPSHAGSQFSEHTVELFHCGAHVDTQGAWTLWERLRGEITARPGG